MDKEDLNIAKLKKGEIEKANKILKDKDIYKQNGKLNEKLRLIKKHHEHCSQLMQDKKSTIHKHRDFALFRWFRNVCKVTAMIFTFGKYKLKWQFWKPKSYLAIKENLKMTKPFKLR